MTQRWRSIRGYRSAACPGQQQCKTCVSLTLCLSVSLSLRPLSVSLSLSLSLFLSLSLSLNTAFDSIGLRALQCACTYAVLAYVSCRYANEDENSDSGFKSSIWKNAPRPWEIWIFKEQFEAKIHNGSGIWDPHFETVRNRITRTDGNVPSRQSVDQMLSSWAWSGSQRSEGAVDRRSVRTTHLWVYFTET